MADSTNIYILKRARSRWGDYSHVLVSGMSAHLKREDCLIQLERTGPFVPPITFPGIGDVVVTDSFRRDIEASGLTGMTFQPVHKRRIVHLEWEKWNWAGEEPDEYPPGGQPEAYILNRPHSPSLAEAIGDLWGLLPQECVELQRVKIGAKPGNVEIRVVASTWDRTDFFRGKGYHYNYVSDRARSWLEKNAGEWVTFDPVAVV
jgi:hypothetical protein